MWGGARGGLRGPGSFPKSPPSPTHPVTEPVGQQKGLKGLRLGFRTRWVSNDLGETCRQLGTPLPAAAWEGGEEECWRPPSRALGTSEPLGQRAVCRVTPSCPRAWRPRAPAVSRTDKWILDFDFHLREASGCGAVGWGWGGGWGH